MRSTANTVRSSNRCLWRIVVLMLLLLTLSACGGGGNDSPTSISVNPRSLSFSATRQAGQQQQSLTVSYKGSGVLIGYAPGVKQPSWLNVTQQSADGTDSAVVSIVADPRFLSPGSYTTTVRFVTGLVPAGGGIADATNVVYADVPVQLTVVDFDVSADSLSFSLPDGAAQPAGGNGSVNLSAPASMHWNATSDQSWLTVKPASGTGPQAITYYINSPSLSLGTYHATIRLTDAAGHDLDVGITITVAPALLTAWPQTLTFNVNADTSQSSLTQSFDISDQLGGNNPAKALHWSIQAVDVPWLSATPTAGSSSPTTTVSASVSAQALATMANGSYVANIVLNYVTEDGQPHTLVEPVFLNLNSPLSSITVTPNNPNGLVGQGPTVQFAATGHWADGYSQDLTEQVNWSSSNATVASISNNSGKSGLAQPLVPGNTTISASYPGNGPSNSTTLSVSAPKGVAYVVSDNASVIYQFIFGDDGALIPMATPSVAAGPRPKSIVFTPNGKYAYVINGAYLSNGQYGLSQFSVDGSGALTPLASPTVSTGTLYSEAITVDPGSKHVYAAICCAPPGSVAQLNIGSDGALSLAASPPISAGSAPESIVVDPTGSYVYASDFGPGSGNGQVLQYAAAADGTLTAQTTPAVAAGLYPDSLVINPSGRNVYVVNFTDSDNVMGTISQYSAGSDGGLTPMSPAKVDAGLNPQHIYIAPSGNTVYVVTRSLSNPSNSGISSFTVDAAGGLTPLSSFTSAYPRYVAVDPGEKYLYLSTGFGTIVQYAIQSNGYLTQVNSAITLTDPGRIVIRKPGN